MEHPIATPPDDRGSHWPPGWHVHLVDETGSTNADLLEAASNGAPHKSVLAARHQTAGRGRLDRRWEAPPGANLLVSVLFTEVPEHANELTQRVALAAAMACERVAGVRPELKWPNDLLLDGAKLAGVLAQSSTSGHDRVVVVGIGVNVGWAPDGAAKLGDAVDPLELLAVLLGELDELDELGAEIWPVYRARLATLGRQVRVELADGEVVGRALDVERDGRLVVLDECGISHRFATGDIVHLRPAY